MGDRFRGSYVCHCGKPGYRSRGAAREAKRRLVRAKPYVESDRNPLNVYRCPTSSVYHVGHRPTRREAWRAQVAS